MPKVPEPIQQVHLLQIEGGRGGGEYADNAKALKPQRSEFFLGEFYSQFPTLPDKFSQTNLWILPLAPLKSQGPKGFEPGILSSVDCTLTFDFGF